MFARCFLLGSAIGAGVATLAAPRHGPSGSVPPSLYAARRSRPVWCMLQPGPRDMFTRIPPPSTVPVAGVAGRLRRPGSAAVSVTHTGFTAQAQAAFEDVAAALVVCGSRRRREPRRSDRGPGRRAREDRPLRRGPVGGTHERCQGVHHLDVPQLGRLELLLGPVDAGYLAANGSLRDLPPGSTLDRTTGVFSWAPGVGYVGTYRLVFLRGGERIPVEVTVGR